VVVGVTNEAEEKVKQYIADKGVKFPIAIVAGNATDGAYGVKGFPHSALVGADGRVLWLGHPASLPQTEVEKALEKATFVPDVPAKFGSIRSDIRKRNFGKAHAAIAKELEKGDKLEEKDRAALERSKEGIEKLAAAKLAGAETLAQAGDYYDAVEMLEAAAKMLKGLDAADEATAKVKAWRADKAVRAQIDAGEDLAKAEALEKAGDPASKAKAYKLYQDIAKKKDLDGTPVAAKAKAAAERLKAGS
jgi:hypothetical protein